MNNFTKREEIALALFAAQLSRPDSGVSLYPELGEKQIQIAFAMADVFLKVANEGNNIVD